MKVKILRNLGTPLQDKLGLDKHQRKECCEGATVDLDDAVAQALVDRRLAEHDTLRGEAKRPAIAEAKPAPKPEAKPNPQEAAKGK